MKEPSVERKLAEGRGQGHHGSYVPWIMIREMAGGDGVRSAPIDPYTGRAAQLLSDGETILWHILRWREDVDDIREQFPLSLPETLAIADEYGFRHPRDCSHPMTSDFLVDFTDGSQAVYSVKSDRSVLQKRRILEKLTIERVYWENQGVPFHLIFKEDMNAILYRNIQMVFPYYKKERVFDESSYIKHLIATKKIQVDDFDNELLDFRELRRKCGDRYDQWYYARDDHTET